MFEPFGAFGGDFCGSLGIPLRVRSIAQAASGSHPSSLVQGVRAMFLRLRINLNPQLLYPLAPCYKRPPLRMDHGRFETQGIA